MRVLIKIAEIKWPWYLLPTNHAYNTTGNKSEHETFLQMTFL